MLSGSMLSSALKAMTLYTLVRKEMPSPSFPHSSTLLITSVSQAARGSESTSIKDPPPLRSDLCVSDLTFPSLAPSSRKALFIFALRCGRSLYFVPSIRNCHALMPSLAASLGFACGGGLMRTDA